jgi:dynein heavy chain, axonemal
VEVKEKWV